MIVPLISLTMIRQWACVNVVLVAERTGVLSRGDRAPTAQGDSNAKAGLNQVGLAEPFGMP